EPTGEPPEEVSRSLVHRLTYPPQEHKLRVGAQPFDEEGRGAGEIVALDREARVLALRRGPSHAELPLPRALVPGWPYSTAAQESALERIGRSLLSGDRRYPAV